MNKKLIAAAVAAACVAGAPAAQAEIKVYSQVQFELTDTDDAGDGTTRVTDNQRGRLGVKGGHDLGGGLKSFAKAEFDFEGGNRDAEFGSRSTTVTDSSSATHTDTQRHAFRVREIVAGLKGSFGSIGLGTVKSAYKYNGGVKYDPYVATQLEQRGRGGMSGGTTGHNGFLNNSFVYGIKAGIANISATYSLDDTDRDGDADGDDGQLTLAARFGNKTWEAGAALQDEGLSGTGNNESVKIFGKFKFAKMHTILAQLEDVDTSATENSDYLMVGYQLKVGKGMVSLYYGERDSNNDAADAENITLAYMHKFNKKSRVWVGYQDYDQNGTAADRERISLGIRVDI